MRSFFRWLCCLVLVLVLHNKVQAGIPGAWYVYTSGGISFAGIASKGSPFTGKAISAGVGYCPKPDAAVGLMITAGYQVNSYRHYFDRSVFVEHIQQGLGSDITAYLPLGERTRFFTGMHLFVPFRSAIDMGWKNANATFFYSNDSLINRYQRSALSASFVMGIQFALGKQKQSYVGIRFAHAGNSPVKEDAEYIDALNQTVTVSKRMKPASVQVSLVFVLAPGKRERKQGSETG